MPKNSKKFYAVVRGLHPGIFQTWDECKKSVHGYPGAKFKSFKTEALASEYIRSFSTTSSSSSSTPLPWQTELNKDAGNKKRSISDDDNNTNVGGVAKKLKKDDDIVLEKTLTVDEILSKELQEAEKNGKVIDLSKHAQKFSMDDLFTIFSLVKTEALALPSNHVKHILNNSTNRNNDVFNMWSDGGANPNPGPGGAGFMICGPLGKKQVILKGSLYLGEDCTNNIAEYTGFICGLKFATSIGIKKLKTHVDSQLVQKQINGQYKVRNTHLIPFQKAAMDIKKEGFEEVEVDWIERALNSEADALATKGMNEKKILFVQASTGFE